MKNKALKWLTALASIYLLLPIFWTALFARKYEIMYENSAVPPPALTQWAMGVYEYTFLFALGVIPLYLLAQTTSKEKNLRWSLSFVSIIMLCFFSAWMFCIWYGLYWPAKVMRDVVS